MQMQPVHARSVPTVAARPAADHHRCRSDAGGARFCDVAPVGPVRGGRRQQRAAHVARVFNSRGGSGVADPGLAVDPEVQRMFQEAQANIMRLNQSRLKALAELKAARERIAELEERLAEAVAEAKSNAQAYLEIAGRFNSNPPPSDGALNGYAQPQGYGEPQAQAPAPPQQQQQAPESPAPTITIAYGTGWDNAHIHFRTNRQDWTQAPGVRMERGSGELEGNRVAVIRGADRVEFVLNNGGSDWDTPDPYGGGRKNYVAEGPGIYFLKSGRLQRLR